MPESVCKRPTTLILRDRQRRGMPIARDGAGRLTFARTLMARYGKKASDKVERAMREMKEGKLRSGKSGKKVTSRKQAVAIGLSEARRAGGNVPRKSSSS